MPVRILLVDDHDVVRQGIRRFLETQPSIEICGEAENGRQAVDKTLELKPDIVVLDLTMPVMNGIEATREIRRLAPRSKIVVFSMHDFSQLAETVKQAGGDAYVSKSAQIDKLYDAIVGVLRPAADSV
jgi:DNA-binding NarL/FixJ family response regulator